MLLQERDKRVERHAAIPDARARPDGGVERIRIALIEYPYLPAARTDREPRIVGRC
jgi:hypothetical protein